MNLMEDLLPRLDRTGEDHRSGIRKSADYRTRVVK
jgi:hypothetical protein